MIFVDQNTTQAAFLQLLHQLLNSLLLAGYDLALDLCSFSEITNDLRTCGRHPASNSSQPKTYASDTHHSILWR
jgi:hypothetical protein